MSKLTEESVGSGVSSAEIWSGSVGKGFNVDVVFVDGEQKVVGSIFGLHRKSTGEVGEDCVASKCRGVLHVTLE